MKGGGARRECSCTGDPHCKPFCGNFFDIQQLGVFRVARIGTEEVQMLTYQCNSRQRWSGGLTVKCNRKIGVRIDGQNVFTADKDRGFRANARGMNGCKNLSGRRVCGRKRGRNMKGNAHLRKMSVRISRQNFRSGAMCVYVSLKGGAKASQNNGICGSGCGKLYGGRGGGRFPCNDCRTGAGVWGGMCNCKKYLTNNQIFSNKFRQPRKMKPVAKPRVNKARLKKLTEGCLSKFAATPFGRVAMRHRALKKVANTAAKACGLDRYSSKKQGNKNAMLGVVCTKTRMMVKKSKPNGVLCQVLNRCGSKSKKCGLKRKRPPKAFMARKRRVKGVNKGGGAPPVEARQKQVERRGGKLRRRARDGAGHGNPKGCKVTQAWANSHVKWCPWAGWSGWRKA